MSLFCKMKFTFLALFCFLFGFVFAEYSDDFSRNIMFPLAAAATPPNPVPCLRMGLPDGKLKRKIEVPCDALNETCSAYSASSDSSKAIILSFRGTEGAYELQEEEQSLLNGKKLIFPGGGMVAEFFYSAFLGIWNGGMKDDFLSLRNSYPDYQIWVTGHSLGGAMAGLCAGYITQVGYVPLTQIRLITFGEPRTGDAKYASLIDQIPYAYRVVHDNDWVPHVPLVPMGYEHHGTQIFYPNLMKPGDPYTVCQGNEDSKCSNSVPADRLNGEAHGWYYNIDINNYESRNCVYNN